MTQQRLVRLAAGIVFALIIGALAYTGTVSTSVALALIAGIAASLGLYERGLRMPGS